MGDLEVKLLRFGVVGSGIGSPKDVRISRSINRTIESSARIVHPKALLILHLKHRSLKLNGQ